MSQNLHRPCRENEQHVEHHIQKAYERREDAWRLHVSGTLHHAGRQLPDEDERNRQAVNPEVGGRIRKDFLLATQPARHRTADRKSRKANQCTQQQDDCQALAQYILCFTVSPCADQLRDLHIKAG